MFKKIINPLAVLALVVLFVTFHAAAQSGRLPDQIEPNKKDDKDTIKLRSEEILLPVSVRSDNGKLPTYLEPTDLIVSEDGKRQKVTSVMRTPANILIVIDTSGQLMNRKDTSLHRELALQIINSLGEEDHGAIISYADQVTLISDWTRNKDELRHALNWKLKPGIESRFYEALNYAAKEMLPKVSGRRSVVLLSDGVDSDSGLLFNEVLANLHRARATLYVACQNTFVLKELKKIAHNPLAWYEMIDPKMRKRYNTMRNYVRQLEAAEVSLKGLVTETGGALWVPQTREEYSALTPKIAEEIGSEYVVAYISEREPEDIGFHSVKVYVTRGELKVRARRGVYPNSQSEKQAANRLN